MDSKEFKRKIKETILDFKNEENYKEAIYQMKQYHEKSTDENLYVFFCIRNKENEFSTMSATVDELLHTDILSQIVEYSIQKDSVCWMSFSRYSNEFSRKERFAKEFNAFVIDFDFYHIEEYQDKTPEAFFDIIKPIVEKYNYTASYSSGHGAYVSFVFDETINCSKQKTKDLHKKKVDGLLQELAPYGADVKCKDFSRIFKPAGTYHPKTGNLAKLIFDTNSTLNYGTFIENLPETEVEITETKKKVKKTKKKKKIKFIKKENLADLSPEKQFQYKKKHGDIDYNYGYKTKFEDDVNAIIDAQELELVDYYPTQEKDIKESFIRNMAFNTNFVNHYSWGQELLTLDTSIQKEVFEHIVLKFYRRLNKGRVKNFEKLVDLRCGHIEYRNNFLLYYGIQVWFLNMNKSEVLESLLRMNAKFDEPYPEKEVRRLYTYIINNEKYLKNREFNFMYFPLKANTIVKIFEITDEELKVLTYFDPTHNLGGHYSYRAKRKIETARHQFLRQKETEAMKYDLQHMSVKEVATKYNCCITTIYNRTKTQAKAKKIEEEVQVINKLLSVGMDKEKIRKELGLSKPTFSNRLKRITKKYSPKEYKTQNEEFKEFLNNQEKENLSPEFIISEFFEKNNKIYSQQMTTMYYCLKNSNGIVKNTKNSLFVYGMICWEFCLKNKDKTGRISYLDAIYKLISAQNEMFRYKLTKAQVLEIYYSILQNDKNLNNENYLNLYVL